jgi:hypothetical protein
VNTVTQKRVLMSHEINYEEGIYSMEEMRCLAGYNLIQLVMHSISQG